MLKDRDREMVAVMPLYSLFNHSCAAQLDYQRVEGGTSDMALTVGPEGIRKGEEVFVRYVDCKGDREARRAKLWWWFGGECRCRKCQVGD